MQSTIGKKAESVHTAFMATSLGPIFIAATDTGICALEFGENESELERSMQPQYPNSASHESPRFGDLVRKAVDVVEGRLEGSTLPLDPRGTDFQRQVWNALRAIPPGTTITYSELASRIGRPRSTRAVATACASNQIAVAIPCHRVVRRDGGLGGYRWGLERKRALLDQERRIAT